MKPNFILMSLAMAAASTLAAADPVFIEAESFTDPGGWTLDTQFVHLVGSPYLLAHGLGRPVADARTTVSIPRAGPYRAWVRTKDWVAHWNAPGAPGRFELRVNGRSVSRALGSEGADWHWQEAGTVSLDDGPALVALHDLTGFDGRCDAILLSDDPAFRPPEGEALASARPKWLGNESGPEDAGDYDLVVVGGGYAGLAAAISAARQSLRVALVQDRFVLGGNGSSEVRVWAQGNTMRGKYPRIGEIVEEFGDHAQDSPGVAEQFGDAKKEAIARREKNLSLFLGHYVHRVELDPATHRILTVIGLDVRSGRERRFRGRLFSDCTGHAVVGHLVGALYDMSPRGRMGMSNMWYIQDEETPPPWPPTPWALALEPGDFPNPAKSRSLLDERPFFKGEWFWESGFDQHAMDDLERIRDWNLRAVYGAFSALKQGADKEKYARATLKWVASFGGPRESRRLVGDVLLSQEDIVSRREFPDGCVPTTWSIDLHYPKEQYAKKFPENPFISRAEFGAGVDRLNGYPVPYRCFYSTNVPNLFMAGRCASVTHEALGTIRVMRTGGMMGEVVGKAAYVCVKEGVDPRQVYTLYWAQMAELLEQPGAMRRDRIDGPLARDPAIPPVAPFGPKTAGNPGKAEYVEASALPGIVIDETKARLKGDWTFGEGLARYIGDGYRYHRAGPNAEARFEFAVPAAGRYEVRVAWQTHENRSTRTACTLERIGHPLVTLRLNQRQESTDPYGFHSIGVFEFAAGGPHALVLATEGADGLVHADCVQILPATN